MATIALELANIPGECMLADHIDQLDAVSLRDSLEIRASQGAGPSVGRAQQRDVELTRYKDRASPKLAQACAAGEDLGEVKIHLFRTVGESVTKFMTYTLTEAFVSRIEYDTIDDVGSPFQPHIGPGEIAPPSELGAPALAGAVASPGSEMIRLAPRSLIGGTRGTPGNREVERLWLNAATIKWTYILAAGGSLEKGWDMRAGRSL